MFYVHCFFLFVFVFITQNSIALSKIKSSEIMNLLQKSPILGGKQNKLSNIQQYSAMCVCVYIYMYIYIYISNVIT